MDTIYPDTTGDPSLIDDGSYNVTTTCGGPNEYDGRLGVRISAIFVILVGSSLGALLPIFLARTKRIRVPPVTFFIAKYFGSGVIIATAFIHLLAPANAALLSPCLSGTITTYPWVEGIALMTIFIMFFIELLVSRFDIFGQPNVEASDPALDLIRKNTIEYSDGEKGIIAPNSGVMTDVNYPPGGIDHLGHQREHKNTTAEHFAAQMTAIFILEFGVIFHSVFIGLTLAVAGEEFNILYIVLVFHQTFEGLGLGSRLATAEWPVSRRWLPWALGLAYGLTTPIAIAAGLGVRETFSGNSYNTLIVNGVFDSISAGILLYTGLVELMAHEFMFSPVMRRSSIKVMLGALLCMTVGAGLMALLGEWA